MEDKNASNGLYPKLNPDGIPEPLKKLPWMGTRFEQRKDGKINKRPYRVRAGLPVIPADKTNPKNHTTYNEALAAYERGDVDAIGVVITDKDSLCVIDQDDAVNPETSEITQRAVHIATTLYTYTELSVSGTGTHSICYADKPGPNCRRDDLGVEIYDGSTGARFMVITGNVLPSLSTLDKQIHRRQKPINGLYRQWWPSEAKPQAKRKPSFERPLDMSDAELLDSARRARKTGAKFQKLYDRGDWSGYKSQSNADYALINLLTYRCAGERDRIVGLFKRSALFRPPPEKARDYVERSVDKFLSTYTGDFYQPRAVREKPVEEQQDILTPYLADLLNAPQWKGPKASAAWKVYAYMIMELAEIGVEASSSELVVGSDVRTIAEGSGVSRTTVAGSSLPFLVQAERIKWRKGAGGRAGTFVLLPPKNSPNLDIKVNTQEYFNVQVWGNGLDALRKLIRMRSGSSVTGRSRQLGTMERVSRAGMVSMFCMLSLITGPCVQTDAEIAQSLGRDIYRVREALTKLKDADIVEVSGDKYALAQGFWAAYDRELKRSLIVQAERNQRKQHAKERRENERTLAEGRANWRAKHDPKVIDMAAKRRKDLDREARLNQPGADEHLTEYQKARREEEALMLEYERTCERVQERLGKRDVRV